MCAKATSVSATALDGLVKGFSLPMGGVLAESAFMENLGLKNMAITIGSETPSYHKNNLLDSWLLVGSLSGVGHASCKKMKVTAAPGWVYAIPPNHPVLESVSGKNLWRFVCLLAKPLNQTSLFGPLLSNPISFQADFSFFEKFVDIAFRLNRREPGDEIATIGLLMELIGECLRQYEALRTRRNIVPDDDFAVRIMRTMRVHLPEEMSLSELARLCGTSESLLSHRFKRETGITPKQWHDRERIAVAKRLLLQGRNVSETSDNLGYANPFHFSRVFAKIEGVSPSLFQRMTRVN